MNPNACPTLPTMGGHLAIIGSWLGALATLVVGVIGPLCVELLELSAVDPLVSHVVYFATNTFLVPNWACFFACCETWTH